MKTVTTTGVFPNGHDTSDALLRLKDVGFRYLDLAIDYLDYPGSPLSSPDWKDWAKSLAKLAEKNGVSYTHAHAPGGASSRNEYMMRSFELCEILGIKYMVVHPISRHRDKSPIEEEEFLKLNLEFTPPLLELAKKHGVTILSENLLWGASIDPRIISKLVERMDSAYLGWCYDIGHANCQEVDVCIIDQKDIITPLSLHLQDNNGIFHKDEHLIPGDGNINWERFLKALAKSGYKGDFVLEAHHQSREAPDDQRDAIIKRLFCKAEELKAQFLRIKGEIQ